MPPLSELVFRRRSRAATSTSASQRKRRRADVALGHAEPLEPRAMLAVTSVVDQLGIAGWAGSFVGVGDVPGSASVNAVASDSSGNRYVGGSFQGKVDFDPGTALVSKTADTTTGFVAKFDSAGKFLSVITLDVAVPVGDDPAGSSSVAALAISGSGKVAIAGDYTGTVDLNPSLTAVSNATGNGAFAVVVGTDWSWQNSLIAFNNVGGGAVEAGVTHVAFVDGSANSTNTNLYLGGWTVAANDSVGTAYDAFILKTKFADADRTDWVTKLGGTDAHPAGLAVTQTGVVLAATYSGELGTIKSLAPTLAVPQQGGIAISLKSDGTFGTGNWVRLFPEQMSGYVSLLQSPAVMPLAVSSDGATVYLATTTEDMNGASSTLYAIKNSGTGTGSDLWAKTTAEVFGDKAPQSITAQTLSLGNGNLYVGGTAIPQGMEASPQIGLTALDPATGSLKGTAVVASGLGVAGRAGTVTADGKVLVGGSFGSSVEFPPLFRDIGMSNPSLPALTSDTGTAGFVAAVANPFLITAKFETFSRPIAGVPDYLSFSLSGDISSTATAVDPNDTYDAGFQYPVIPISAFRLTKNGTDVSLTNKVIARIQNFSEPPAEGQPLVGRTLFIDGLSALTSSPGTYVLSFDWARLSAADKLKVTPALPGAAFGTAASATYTVVAPVTSVSGPKGFAGALASNSSYFFDRGPIEVSDVVTDAAGLTYVAGSFSGTADFDPSSATQNRTSTAGTDSFGSSSSNVSSQDGFVAIYNANGSFSKVIVFPGSGDLMVDQIALDGSGKLIVAGSSRGVNTGFPTSESWNGFVLSLDTATGVPSKLQTLATSATMDWERLVIWDLERDATGAAYVVGRFSGDLTVGTTKLEQGFRTPFIAAFQSSAAPGAGLAPITAAAIDPALAGLNEIRSFDLAITSSGIPVLGAIGSKGTDFTLAAALAGINTSTGTADWVESVPLGGVTSGDEAFISLAADNAGRVYAGVATVRASDPIESLPPTVGPSGLVAVQVTKTATAGANDPLSKVAQLWTKTSLDIGVEGYDGLPLSISVDNAGSVFVSGDAFETGDAVYLYGYSGFGNGSVGSFIAKVAAADGTFDPAKDLLFHPERAAYGQFQPVSGKFVNFGTESEFGYSVNGAGETKLPSPMVILPSLQAAFFSVLSSPFSLLPDAPTLAPVGGPGGLTNAVTPTFSGLATKGSTVTIYAQKLIDGQPSGSLVTIGTKAASATDGKWSFPTPTAKAFTQGDWRVDATQTVAGDEGKAASITLKVDTSTTAPAGLDLDASSDTGSSDSDNYTSDTTPTIKGTAEAGSTVTVLFNGTSSGTTLADDLGSWSFTPTKALSAGPYSVTATAVDKAGNPSIASAALKITLDTLVAAPSAPDLTELSDLGTSKTDNKTSQTTPTFTGTAEANSVVEVFATKTGGQAVSLGKVATTGTTTAWTFITPAGKALADGTYSITAKTTDQAGNESASSAALTPSLEIRTVAPPAPLNLALAAASDSGVSNSDRLTKVTTPQFTGNADKGGTVTVIAQKTGLGGGNVGLPVTLGTTLAAATDGKWSLNTPSTKSLTAGNWVVTATVADVFGKESAASDPLTVTVDLTNPVVNSMTIDGSTTSDSWVRTGVITFSRPVKEVTTGDFEITGFFFGATRTVRLNDPNVASVVGGVRVVPLNAVNGFASTWYLDVRQLSLQNGSYTIKLVASGSGIVDEVGNALTADKTLSLTVPLTSLA